MIVSLEESFKTLKDLFKFLRSWKIVVLYKIVKNTEKILIVFLEKFYNSKICYENVLRFCRYSQKTSNSTKITHDSKNLKKMLHDLKRILKRHDHAKLHLILDKNYFYSNIKFLKNQVRCTITLRNSEDT